METTGFPVYLSSWKEEGKGLEHVLGPYIISSNLHGNLFVGDPCFQFRNGKQVWLSSWPRCVVPRPEAERVWLSGPIILSSPAWSHEKKETFDFVSFHFVGALNKNHFENPLAL